jgi:hypothetical protein
VSGESPDLLCGVLAKAIALGQDHSVYELGRRQRSILKCEGASSERDDVYDRPVAIPDKAASVEEVAHGGKAF